MSLITIPEKHHRLVTGIILFIILAAALSIGGLTLRIAVLFTALLGLYEFFELFWPKKEYLYCKIGGYILTFILIIGSFASPAFITIAFIGAVLFAALMFLVKYGRGNESASLTEYTPLLFGLLYIPFILQMALNFSLAEQILVIGAAALTDTGGYYVGTKLGKHKIWPAVSPKKSWEGTIGGMVCCVIFCCLMGTYGIKIGLALPDFSLLLWVLIGILLNIASQLGDYFESALKRSAAVKDSSSLLPGHGGILDRLDSILFAVPTYFFARTVAEGIEYAVYF